MTRVRSDNTFGTTTDNPLTAAATTMNSAGLANLAVVSSAEAIIILDPNRLTGAPEIVVVTAHTGSATSATIVRGQFGTTARQHAAGTEWVHGPIASNATTFVTASDDQGDFVPPNAWETYTPSNVNITVGNGTETAFFQRIGRLIAVRYSLTFGTTTSFGGQIQIGLPVASVSASVHQVLAASILDASAGFYVGAAVISQDSNASRCRITHSEIAANTGNVNATAPMTWTTSDRLTITGTYEAAS